MNKLEIVSLLKKRNIIIVSILFFVLNIGLFIKEQADNFDVKIQDIYLIKQVIGEHENPLIRQEESYFQKGTDVILAEKSSDELTSIEKIRILIKQQIDTSKQHSEGYEEKISGIEARKQKLSEFTIFSENNSFAKKNSIKTWDDFKKLREVEITEGNDWFIVSIFSYSMVHYLLLLVMLLVVLTMIDNSRGNMRLVLFATARGRGYWSLKRVGVMSFIVFMYTVCFYSALILASAAIYGVDNIQRSIQSISVFGDFTMLVSVGEFFLLYVVLTAMGILLVVLLFWLLCCIFTTKNVAILVFGGLLLCGYSWLSTYSNNSTMALLRFMNLYFFIEMNELFTNYLNFKIGNEIVGAYELVVGAIICTILICTILIVYYHAKVYPIRRPSIIDKLYGSIVIKIRSITEYLNTYWIEIYKIMILRKGFLILLLFFLVAYNEIDTKQVYYSTDASSYNVICNTVGNQPVNDEIITYIKDVTKTKEDTGSLKLVNEKIEYLNELKTTQAIDGFLMREYGYNQLLSKESMDNNMKTATLTTMCIILLTCGVFEIEKKKGMQALIRSSKSGRVIIFKEKIKLVILCTVITFLCIYGLEFYGIYMQYEMDCFTAPVKTLEYMQNTPFNMSLGKYIICLYAFRLLLYVVASVSLCSLAICFNYATSFCIGLCVYVLPGVLYFSGITVFKKLSFTYYMNAVDQLVSENGRVTLLLVMSLYVVFAGIITYIAKRKWCDVGNWEE